MADNGASPASEAAWVEGSFEGFSLAGVHGEVSAAYRPIDLPVAIEKLVDPAEIALDSPF